MKYIIVPLLVLTGCAGVNKTVKDYYKYELYIDYKYTAYQGRNDDPQTYYLCIDSVKGMWYDGKLIINNTDTLYLHGFEKGTLYPTHYFNKHTKKDGTLFINKMNECYLISDSISIKDLDQDKGLIKGEIYLQRRSR
ncbi:MAG: hypothetical protein ACJ75J_17260 [Cytophagaceae bacterium]